MTQIFIKLLNMSIAASWLALTVLLVRVFMKRMPKWISCILWGLVALRLLIPFYMESGISLIPSGEVIPQDIVTSQAPAIHSGIPVVNAAVNPVVTQQVIREASSLYTVLSIASRIWIAGMTAMLLYAMISHLVLQCQIRASIRKENHVFVCDDVDSPFILGVLRPKIYIPSGMDETQLRYVLAHENAHIRRRDHWWKPIGFVLLAVYWFNPLLWVAYGLLCRDIEQACDEKVIAEMDGTGKKEYSQALVDCSVHRRMMLSCPLAFGETSVKSRVKGVLNYKKPTFWILITAIAACVVISVCFLTNPKTCPHIYHSQIVTEASCTEKGVEKRICKLCDYSYTAPTPVIPHTYDQGTVLQASTCTAEGVMQHHCVHCGHGSTAPIRMLPHTYDQGTVLQAPTCVKTGMKEQTCTGCGGKTQTVMEIIAHTPGELTITKEPNCVETGERMAVCTYCQSVCVRETLEKNDVHDFLETVTKYATCTASGEGIKTCTRCEHTENCIYEPAEHNFRKGVSFPASCVTRASQAWWCVDCGYTYEEFGDYGDHYVSSGICLWCGKYFGGYNIVPSRIIFIITKEVLL